MKQRPSTRLPEKLSVSGQRAARAEALWATIRESDRPIFDPRPPYTPHGAAADLHAYTGREIVISGPAGTGKSRACLEKLHRLALAHPRIRALIARKTRASLTESGLVTFEQHVLGTYGASSAIATDILRRNRQSYRYPNGSEIIVGGLDRASRIMSTEFDLIFVQEATELTENDWESLLTRLRHDKMPFQQLIADCNPDHPEHWLKKRAESGRVRMLFSRHEDNPALYDSASRQWTDLGREYIAVLDALTGVRYHRLRHGKWMQTEGAVYEEYNAGIHVIDRFDIPDDWRRIRVIDFGFVNAFVTQWWAIDPDGRMYRYREIYMTRRIVEDHARQILRYSEGERIECTIADHDAEDRATLERYGISTVPAIKDISPGIQSVQKRLRIAHDGRPRLFFLRDSLVERDARLSEAKLPTCTEEEITGYVWPQGRDGRPQKEVPVKEFDHGLDCTRYASMYVDQPAPSRAIEIGESPFGWE